jgi:hypothetical protein
MRLDEIRAGDVLWFWYANGHEASDQIAFHRVIRVNRTTVTVENRAGDVVRVQPGEYSGKVKPHEWSPWNPDGR